MATTALRRGVVTAFDDDAGLGEITGDDGAVIGFQCTRIADGSRTIPEGAYVSFDVVPGPTGLEAVDLRRRTT